MIGRHAVGLSVLICIQQVLGQLMQHMTDQVMVLGLFYGAEASMFANRLRNVTPGSTMAWNAHEWDAP